MKLYEINQTYQEFLDQIASGEIPEEAISDTLEALNGEFEDKADNIACYIKSLLSDTQAIKAESDALLERAKAKKTKADRLTDYLYQAFKVRGKEKLETTRNLLKIRKNPPAVQIDDEAAFISWTQEQDGREALLTIHEPTINKTAIKNALKAGEKIPHAKLVSSEKLTIK
jgi:phage host-nuclease inhibitor protein Gam